MAILGRGISGLPLSTDSLIVGVGGVLDELPVGTLNQVLTITGAGVDWASATMGTVTGGTNLAAVEGRVFSGLNGNNLEFRALVAGPGITITENLNDITIENTAGASVTSVNGDIGPAVVLGIVDIDDVVFPMTPANSDVLTFNLSLNQWESQPPPGAVGGEANTASNIGAGTGIFDNKVSQDLQFRSITGTNGITATLNIDVIEIDGTNIDGTVTSIGIIDSSGGQDLIVSGSPITTAGNINVELAIIAAVAGTYTTPINVTVDNKGRITAIADGGAASLQNLYETIAADTGFTTAGTATDTLTIAGGLGIETTATADTITLNLGTSGVISGTFSLPTVTVDLQGRITSISNGTALLNMVEDTTPQLGGNLDVQASKITTSTVNGDILIEPNGIGFVIAQVGYDMSSGPDAAFASKLYVDTQLAGAGVQNLFETVTGDTGTITAATATDTFQIAGGTDVTTSVSGSILTIDFTNTALFNVVEDLTPQLGGNLDVQAFGLTTSTLNANITLTPNGTGKITGPVGYDVTGGAAELLANKAYVDAQIVGAGTNLETLTDTSVAGKATDDILVFTGTTWDPVSDITVNTLKFKDHGANGNTWIIEEDAGATNALTFDYNLIERGRLSATGDLTLTGGIVVPGTTTLNTVVYTWPAVDGSNGQVLSTNGSGVLSFTATGGTQNVYESISGDTGTPTTASIATDTLDIAGGTGISTVVTVDTLTINNDITSIDDLSDVDTTTAAPTLGQILEWDNTNWVPATNGGGGISNVVEDVTPQLGANLDVQTFALTTSTVNGDITITPNGTGNTTLTAGDLILTEAGALVDGRDLTADGTKLDAIETSATADQTGAEIKTAYEAEVSAFTDTQFTKLAGIETSATADQTAADIRTLGFFDITNDGAASGLDADLLDGNEATAFALAAQGTTADSALQNVVEDTAPQLGGPLDVNANDIDFGEMVYTPSGSAIINDNQIAPDPITTYVGTDFKGVFIDYVIVRGGDGKDMGSFQILNDGTNIASSDTQTTIGVSGVTLAATIAGGTVTFEYTSTSTTNSGNITFHMRKMNVA